ncbi:alpha/beta hydrolase family protein [Streptosporangium sp. G11]|uniref:alpha/beta hydrolase family protein n=1 Tax=Streptosporangium sp. G11 TaxID=3436926 RepID=UPI003EC058F8
MPAFPRDPKLGRTGWTIVGLGVAATLLAPATTSAAAAGPGSHGPAAKAPGSSASIGGSALADTAGASATALRMSLPKPTGRYPIGTVALHLVDRSRPDSLVTSRPYRELMVSVWYPARGAENLPLAPQMPPLAAADFDQDTASDLGIKPGEVNWAATRTHARTGAPVDRRAGALPVVLYSPGLDGPRTLGTVLVEELASRGYVVVTVDHTYQPDQVEFPGGRVERARLPPVPDKEAFEKLTKVLLATRVEDMRFVLDRLARLDRGHNPDEERAPLPAGLSGALDLSRTGMFGHSFGGATAAQLTRDDRRVDAGINLDGTLFGPVVRSGLAKPFLQVAGEPTTRESEPTWKSFWDRSSGWKREVRFTGAQHLSFMDVQAMIPQVAGKLGKVPVAEIIGTIDPERSVTAQRAYVTAFFDLHLRGRHTRLFDGPARRYPEVKLIP